MNVAVEGITPLQDFDDPHYNPFAVEDGAYGDIEDIHTPLAELRAKGPIHEVNPLEALGWQANPGGGYGVREFLAVRHDIIDEVLNNQDSFSIEAYKPGMGATFGETLSVLMPPDHARIRRVFQRAFFPNVVAKWGDDVIAPEINKLIDGFIDRGHADMVEEFTHLYPFHIIFRQLDLPKRDIALFHKLAASLTHLYGDYMAHALEASQKLGVYLRDLIEARQARPGNDLVSHLVNAQVDGDYIPEINLVSFLRQLLNAGGDTTYRATGTMLVGLLRNPDQFEAVRKDRSLVPNAIEEALRWDGPSPLQLRTAIHDTELAGIHIPAGSIVYCAGPAVNRDPDLFENPNEYNIHRGRSKHYSFSSGPHICVGQHLARVEMSHALNIVLDRLPKLRFDPDKPAARITGIYFRTPQDLHVRFD